MSNDQPAADIVINFQEIEFRELEALVDFMYHGDVTVRCNKVELFARAADKLKIVGLAGTIGTHIADLLHREGIVGNPGLESSSELHQQQEKSQNVQKKCKMPNASTTEQQQGKRNADLDPAQGPLNVKIPPAATKTSQSTLVQQLLYIFLEVEHAFQLEFKIKSPIPMSDKWRKLQGMAGKQTVMTARLVPNMEFL
ncbi:Broad-complex core protein isoform 6 [Orchesella cincta]|uniref:Broad-complex core protein isoform 6 n=1 Tax=Orchesella cincta TaxID=48709 RepID=A0A1D2M0Y1_ORCCI|nr:Broad-complex core protein isoform 6 [Orchesella cincta]